MNWMDELTEQAKMDMLYLQSLTRVKETEPAFLALRDSLPEEQRELLDQYIAACEELEHALAPIAYRMGKEQQKPKPE